MPTTVAAATNVKSGGSRVAHAVTRKGKAYTLGMTPETSTIAGLSYTVVQIQRPGLVPLLRMSAPQLRTFQFTHVVIRNVLTTISSLQALARSGLEVRFVALSSMEGAVWWRISDLSITITERLPDQSPKTASVIWSLIESIDMLPKIGKTPPPAGLFAGDLNPLPTPPPDIANPGDADRRKRAGGYTYTVRGQKTLYGVAGEVWGNSTWWPAIASANADKIQFDSRYTKTPPPPGTDAYGRRFLRPGLVLTIPPEPTSVRVPTGVPTAPGTGRHQA